MEITINHQKRTLAKPPTSLEELLLSEFPDPSKSIAVAVNDVVIPKAEWHGTRLQNADNILIITPTQGG